LIFFRFRFFAFSCLFHLRFELHAFFAGRFFGAHTRRRAIFFADAAIAYYLLRCFIFTYAFVFIYFFFFALCLSSPYICFHYC